MHSGLGQQGPSWEVSRGHRLLSGTPVRLMRLFLRRVWGGGGRVRAALTSFLVFLLQPCLPEPGPSLCRAESEAGNEHLPRKGLCHLQQEAFSSFGSLPATGPA